MNKKIHLVKYYIDYETHGVEAVFKNKEDAEKYAEDAEKLEYGTVSYSVSEEILYESYQEFLEVRYG